MPFIASVNDIYSIRPPSIDLFAATVAILISIISNSYYGMPRGQIHFNLPPEHPMMSFETIEIKMAALSAKGLCALFENNLPLNSNFVKTA